MRVVPHQKALRRKRLFDVLRVRLAVLIIIPFSRNVIRRLQFQHFIKRNRASSRGFRSFFHGKRHGATGRLQNAFVTVNGVNLLRRFLIRQGAAARQPLWLCLSFLGVTPGPPRARRSPPRQDSFARRSIRLLAPSFTKRPSRSTSRFFPSPVPITACQRIRSGTIGSSRVFSSQ